MKYNLKSSRHSKHSMHAHLVFTPKYRKRIFTKEHIDYMKAVFINICENFESELIEFDGEDDHVHLLVQYHPKVAISTLIHSLKGVSSRKLRKKFPIFKKVYWENKVALWSPSYFAGSVGGATIEIMKQYIEQQSTPH